MLILNMDERIVRYYHCLERVARQMPGFFVAKGGEHYELCATRCSTC